METILLTHTIEEQKIILNFDMQDGSLSFPSLTINVNGDIDLNSLIIKLTELIELDRELQMIFNDPLTLLESNPKILLIKETLDEIYNQFNKRLEISINTELPPNDDLPF